MPNTIKGQLKADPKARWGIIVGRFNEFISSKLVEGAVDSLVRHGADDSKIDVVWVPGSFETPMVAKRLVESKKYAAVICLGAVIRGATPHFDFVAAEATKGVAAVAQEASCPVVFGVLTCDHMDQAWERAGGKAGNKGADAARAALELVDLYRQIG